MKLLNPFGIFHHSVLCSVDDDEEEEEEDKERVFCFFLSLFFGLNFVYKFVC